MHKITYSDGSTGIVYDTLEDFLALQTVNYIREDDNYYYIKPLSDCFYDNSFYKVDKKSHKAEYMLFTEFIIGPPGIEGTRPVDFQTLKRAS